MPKEAEKHAKRKSEKCREHRLRLQIEDSAKDAKRKQKNRSDSKRWHDSLGPKEIERQKQLCTPQKFPCTQIITKTLVEVKGCIYEKQAQALMP